MLFGQKKRLAEALANLLGCKIRDICLNVDSDGIVTFRAFVNENFEKADPPLLLEQLDSVISFVNKKWRAGDELSFTGGVLALDKGTGEKDEPGGEEIVEEEEKQAPFDGGTESQIDFSVEGVSCVDIREYEDDGYHVGSFSYPSASVCRVEVNWALGNIEIVEKDGDTLYGYEEDANLSDEARVHCFLGDDGVLHVEAGASGVRLYFRNWEFKNFRLEVPSNVDISISNDFSDIIAESLHDGEVSLSSSSGDIRVDSLQTDSLDASTASGDINIGDAAVNAASLNSSSGDIDFACGSGNSVEVSSSSGDISLDLGSIDEVMISTASGDVDVSLGEGGATLEFSTASGDLYINSDYENDDDGNFIIGDGETSLEVSTSSGDCTID